MTTYWTRLPDNVLVIKGICIEALEVGDWFYDYETASNLQSDKHGAKRTFCTNYNLTHQVLIYSVYHNIIFVFVFNSLTVRSTRPGTK